MIQKQKEVRLAGAALGRSRHVCAFFHTKDEEYRVLLPFIKEGFDQGDKAFHIVKDDHRPEHRRQARRRCRPRHGAESRAAHRGGY